MAENAGFLQRGTDKKQTHHWAFSKLAEVLPDSLKEDKIYFVLCLSWFLIKSWEVEQ